MLPCPVALLQPADAVLEPGRAGHRPGAGQGLLVAQVGPELRAPRRSWRCGRVVGLGRERRVDLRQVLDVGDLPRLGAVGEVAVGEQQHRGPVGDRDPDGLDRVARSSRRATAARRSAPAPRRCGRTSPAAGRPARSWWAARSRARRAARRPPAAAAPSSRPGRSSPPSARCPGPEVVVTPRRPAERGAEGRADAGDLVLGLEGGHAEPLVLAQLVQDVRGRGDRVGARGTAAARTAWSRRSDRRRAPGCR